MPRRKFEAGARFGRLTVLGDEEPVRKPRQTLRRVRCRCDCGLVRVFMLRDLTSGHTQSCGCYAREEAARRETIHGMSAGGKQQPEYTAWMHAKRRCTAPTDPQYPDYGGRGITMCDRWLHSFANFHADMGRKPSTLHSLDRIDNDGPYAPENCRWTTKVVQMRNTRHNRNLTFEGRTQCLSEWAREKQLPVLALWLRLYRHGWSVERALTTPLRRR